MINVGITNTVEEKEKRLDKIAELFKDAVDHHLCDRNILKSIENLPSNIEPNTVVADANIQQQAMAGQNVPGNK